MVKDYRKQHIIKHALEMYIQREGASEKDIRQEKSVLREVKDNIQAMKEEYGLQKMAVDEANE